MNSSVNEFEFGTLGFIYIYIYIYIYEQYKNEILQVPSCTVLNIWGKSSIKSKVDQ